MKFSFDLLRSVLRVESSEPFPIQAKKARESEWVPASKIRRPSFPEETTPSKPLDGPTLDESVSVTARSSKDIKTPSIQVNHFSQLGGEILGLDGNLFLRGNENKISSWRAQFSRIDNHGRLLGPLGLNRIQFLDIDTPGIPLLTGGISGKGVLLSSFQQPGAGRFDQQDFFGDLRPGWDVFLYRNDVFIGKQTGNNSGRFKFSSVPVFYGRNRFRFLFFGPHGERLEEQKNVLIDSALNSPFSSEYWFSMLMENPEENRKIYRQNTLFNYSYGLSQGLSLGAGFLKDRDSGFTLGSFQIFGANRYFNFVFNFGINDLGGKAFEWLEQTRIFNVDFSAKYARFLQFTSPETLKLGSGLKSNLDLTSQYTLPTMPSLSFLAGFQQLSFLEKVENRKVTQSLGVETGGFGINHQVNYQLSENGGYQGKGNLTSYISDLRIRGDVSYSFKAVQLITGELSLGRVERVNTTLQLQYDLVSKMTLLGASYSRRFPSFLMSFDINYRTMRDFSLGLSFVTSILREPQRNQWHFSSYPHSNNGAATVKVCLDKNRNQRCEEGEKNLTGLHVVLNGRDTEEVTDSSGVVFLSHLSTSQSHDVTLSYSEINDPLLKLGKKGIKFFPRNSKVTELTLPLVTVGSIEGNVFSGKGDTNKVMGREEVLLLDAEQRIISKTKTDRQGNYVFEDLEPGKYSVSLSKWPNVKQMVVIPEEGDYISGVDIYAPQ